MTYKEMLNLPPDEFVSLLDRHFVTGPVDFDIENPESAVKAGKVLSLITSNYSVLSALYSYAAVEKRRLSRDGKRDAYQDMIDKENAVKNVRSAVEMQQKTLSKLLSLHMDLRRELYMADTVRKPKETY